MNEKEIKTGWKIVTGLLLTIVLLSVLRLLLPLLSGRSLGLGSLVSFALTLWLCWLVYAGNGVARFILVALILLNAVLIMVSGAALGAGVIVGIGVIQLLFGAALFLIPQVNRYFEYVKNYQSSYTPSHSKSSAQARTATGAWGWPGRNGSVSCGSEFRFQVIHRHSCFCQRSRCAFCGSGAVPVSRPERPRRVARKAA